MNGTTFDIQLHRRHAKTAARLLLAQRGMNPDRVPAQSGLDVLEEAAEADPTTESAKWFLGASAAQLQKFVDEWRDH